jgi:hypothetical protein
MDETAELSVSLAQIEEASIQVVTECCRTEENASGSQFLE